MAELSQLKVGVRVLVKKAGAYHNGKFGEVVEVSNRGKHDIMVLFSDGQYGFFQPSSLIVAEPATTAPAPPASDPDYALSHADLDVLRRDRDHTVTPALDNPSDALYGYEVDWSIKHPLTPIPDELHKAHAELDRIERERDELRAQLNEALAALKPFAELVDYLDTRRPIDIFQANGEQYIASMNTITVRRAAEVVRKLGGGAQPTDVDKLRRAANRAYVAMLHTGNALSWDWGTPELERQYANAMKALAYALGKTELAPPDDKECQ